GDADDRICIVTDLSTLAGGHPVQSIAKGHSAGVTYADFDSDNDELITVSRDQTARIWRFGRQSGQMSPGVAEQATVLRHHDQVVEHGNFRHRNHDDLVVTAGGDGTARVWKNSGDPIAIFQERFDPGLGESQRRRQVIRSVFTNNGTGLTTLSL